MSEGQLTATFEVTGWDENPYDEGEGLGKLTRASVSRRYQGDVKGESATEWLMAYQPDGTAVFVGLERLRGEIDGREGTVVLQHVGAFSDGAATANLTVVTGSGTGELADVAGSGTFRADPEGSITLDLT